MLFHPGQTARIKETAFPGSNEPDDIAARGETGTLVAEIDDGLWLWKSDTGHIAYPITTELEEPAS